MCVYVKNIKNYFNTNINLSTIPPTVSQSIDLKGPVYI